MTGIRYVMLLLKSSELGIMFSGLFALGSDLLGCIDCSFFPFSSSINSSGSEFSNILRTLRTSILKVYLGLPVYQKLAWILPSSAQPAIFSSVLGFE